MRTTLEQLRDLLHHPPAPEHWNTLCYILEEANEDDLEICLTYAHQHTQHWPMIYKVWRCPQHRGWNTPPPWASLARIIDLSRINLTSNDLKDLLDAPIWSFLEGLNLCNALSIYDPESMEDLLQHEATEHIRWLDLGENGLQDDSLLQSASFYMWKNLHHLNLPMRETLPLKDILAHPWLEDLNSLQFTSQILDSQVLQDVLQAPHRERLKHLDLRYAHLHDTAAEGLQNLPCLASLETLNLSGNKIKKQLLLDILQHTSKLQTLDLYSTDLDDETLVQILKILPTTDLKHLMLGVNQITADGLRALVQAPNMANLETLDLSQNNFQPGDMIELAQPTTLHKLQSLNLCGNEILQGDAQALARSNLKNLTKLDLSYCDMSSGGMQALANTTGLNQLQHLNLTHCRLQPEDVVHLMQAPWITQLLSLNLSNNAANQEGIRALCAHPHTALRELSFNNNNLQVGCFEQLWATRGLQHLESLHLRTTGMGLRDLEMLCQHQHFPRLRNLDLSNNSFTAHALRPTGLSWRHVQKLALRGANLPTTALISLLQNLPELQELNLEGSPLEQSFEDLLALPPGKLGTLHIDQPDFDQMRFMARAQVLKSLTRLTTELTRDQLEQYADEDHDVRLFTERLNLL